MSIHNPIPLPIGESDDGGDAEARVPDATPLLPDDAIVPVAARHDGWTPDRQRVFIEGLASCGNVAMAARRVGMTVESAYRLRRRADAAGFDRAWNLALSHLMDRLLPAAVDRAINGSLRTRYYRGEVIAEEHVHHDGLLLYLLQHGQAMMKANSERRHRFGELDTLLDQIGKGEAPPPEAPESRLHYRLWYSHLGGWMTNCPPPPAGNVGFEHGSMLDFSYRRTLTDEEEGARQRLVTAGLDSEEAMRRRLFALAPGWTHGLFAHPVSIASLAGYRSRSARRAMA